ncbi:MAG: YggS family pyridoxal phosphate-dependent enzyme [Anaerolineales bacterium]|nr:YggS family pyridoxal phosphate-dependent enzyme [Chloroflexota bacterium]MBL6982396.1 YggS family pyridoxal phosphate-dependent enzyme [Anaerolineales bacterium]
MVASLSESISENIAQVMERIAAAARSVGRDAADVKLIVVTKGHTVEVTQAAIQAGAKYIGENYVQEALAKMESLPNEDVEWHMIGHVQSRKARDVVENFAWMHTLDRLKVARRCDQFAAGAGVQMPVLLECNVSSEASKHGWSAWDEMRWPEFAEELAPVFELNHLEVQGLMTMPPFFADPEEARPYFEKLRRLRDFLVDRFPQSSWKELSMGMSNDYAVAIQEGATFVRVGTAILGTRS